MQNRLVRPLAALFAAAIVTALIATIKPQFAPHACFVNALAAVLIFLGMSGGSGESLQPVSDAIRLARKGKHAELPEHASPDLARAIEDLNRLGDEHAELKSAHEATQHALAEARESVHAQSRAGEEELSRLKRELESAKSDLKKSRESAMRPSELREPVRVLSEAVGDIEQAQPAILTAAGDLLGHVRSVNQTLVEVYQSIEALAKNAEESSSSILEMTTTNEEVAQNVAELAASVRETATSIEEMAYSIREVARNIDALSLTAEETSSSMNEMDVSIDQVQSNANETARLSEEVALDAERGAESILKTIGEIGRIRESSQEAVSVISNLGTRIDAIGQILAVIDDVAEQTNLLALNAAIIAAQAGEHGKGFAVVADEIKDLAERAGGSTKEIAELIKTIQAESRNAISAVERGAQNVSRGVEVSNEAERALKKILESSQKSTAMVRAIARATVEQAKGSKQVTDAIGRIAETVQQIAAATAQQARGSDQIMKSAEKMRMITQHVERSSQEQARGGRQITSSIEQISSMVNTLNASQRSQRKNGETLIDIARRVEELSKGQQDHLRGLRSAFGRVDRTLSEPRTEG
jgi:methyl-accepting chemotaxis protein